MPKISIIAAVADNMVIGRSNKLPWRLSADLKRFKQLTTGYAVIMGKRTFESLPNGPLPNRKNVVLTSLLTEGITEGYFEAVSVEDALELCEKEEKVFIIGGGAVYKQTLDIADELQLTKVHADVHGDAYFPEIDFSKWTEISREDFPADEKNEFPYSFIIYQRK